MAVKRQTIIWTNIGLLSIAKGTVKFLLIFKYFHSRKRILEYRLEIGGHFD